MCLHVAIQLRHGNITLHLTCTHKTSPCHMMGTYTHAASHPYEHAACGSSNPSVWQTPCRIRSHHTWTSYQSLLSLSPLSHLMMTLNMQLKTSLRRVLLATPRVGTREHLHFAQFPRLHWCCACGFVGAAVRHRTDEIAGSMGIVCSHVNVQIAAPIKHSSMKRPRRSYLLQPMIGHRYVCELKITPNFGMPLGGISFRGSQREIKISHGGHLDFFV